MALEMQYPKTTQGKPTQEWVPVADVRDNCLIMSDGTLRAVLAVSSTNFDLKNEDEQNGIIYAYQRFLNSLEYPIQVVMQSRKLDVNAYVEKLRQLSERQTNELLKAQGQTYIEFIQQLVENANVMSKNFYIVIPYSISVNPTEGGGLSKLFGKSQAKQTEEKLEKMQKYGELLDQRVNSVASNLSGMGIKGVRLDTAGLIELLYASYNFEAAPNLVASKLGDLQVMDRDKETGNQ